VSDNRGYVRKLRAFIVTSSSCLDKLLSSHRGCHKGKCVWPVIGVYATKIKTASILRTSHKNCIVNKYLYSASHGVSQTNTLSVHFSSRKKDRFKARERDEEREAERLNEGMMREAIPE